MPYIANDLSWLNLKASDKDIAQIKEEKIGFSTFYYRMVLPDGKGAVGYESIGRSMNLAKEIYPAQSYFDNMPKLEESNLKQPSNVIEQIELIQKITNDVDLLKKYPVDERTCKLFGESATFVEFAKKDNGSELQQFMILDAIRWQVTREVQHYLSVYHSIQNRELYAAALDLFSGSTLNHSDVYSPAKSGQTHFNIRMIGFIKMISFYNKHYKNEFGDLESSEALTYFARNYFATDSSTDDSLNADIKKAKELINGAGSLDKMCEQVERLSQLADLAYDHKEISENWDSIVQNDELQKSALTNYTSSFFYRACSATGSFIYSGVNSLNNTVKHGCNYLFFSRQESSSNENEYKF
ncbi:hypothetical protein L3V79_03340 [Thiotrichales bacterium 19S9-12]|nr:hypothetical protein [Thiotrichales bacterium 19S9-11]MCF6811394.1 hypothetical protein [Thiotrichales bacterium 19S9-12]